MADDEQLESRTLVLYTTPGVAIRNSGSSSDYCYPTYSDYCILPAFSGFGWWSSRTGSVGFFPAATISLSFGKLSSEVLANATDIRTSVRFFVPGPSVTTNMDVEVSEHKKLFPLED
jgi:hypothetical protein